MKSLISFTLSLLIGSTFLLGQEKASSINEKQTLSIKAPEHPMFSTVSISINGETKIDGRVEKMSTDTTLRLKFSVFNAPTATAPGSAACSFERIDYRLGNMKISSDDPLPKGETDTDKFKKGMIIELKDVVDNCMVDMIYDNSLKKVSNSNISKETLEKYRYFKSVVSMLNQTSRLTGMIMGDSRRFLPDHPVKKGEIWYIESPHPFLKGKIFKTRVKLVDLQEKDGDTVALLQMSGNLSFNTPREVVLPSGQKAMVNQGNVKNRGIFRFNITRQREEAGTMTTSMSYSFPHGKVPASTTMTIKNSSIREYQDQ